MDDTTQLTSIDWRTIAGVVSAICALFGVLSGLATRYLGRLIGEHVRASSAEFLKVLDLRFLSADNYAVDQLKRDNATEKLIARLESTEKAIVRLDRSLSVYPRGGS